MYRQTSSAIADSTFNQSINQSRFICFAACTDGIGYNNIRTYTLPLKAYIHYTLKQLNQKLKK